MVTIVERFLFSNFSKMPAPVRVFTYLFLLLVFTYLLLVPRFINGKLVVESPNGGARPYRGGVLQMHSDGRVMKFTVNEQGYWSIPIVSLVPQTVRVEVLHVDADAWFPVDITVTQLWTHDVIHVVVRSEPPGVQLVSRPRAQTSLAGLGRWLPAMTTASAGELELPAAARQHPMDPITQRQIEQDVLRVVTEITGRPADLQSRFSGAGAPSYERRIAIVQQLETRFKLVIPDDHWAHLSTVGQLVDYVQKRTAYRRWQGDSSRDLGRKPSADPRPVFKR
jgi:acyl carrier protein